MKIEVYILTLRGNLAAIRDYANTIANMDPYFCNAYVMAFDKDNEILWTVQAGDDLDEVKATINWQGVRRVEIYDHSVDGACKIEQVYITSRKSLDAYTSERSASEFRVVGNTTQYEVVLNEDEDDNTNEGDQTPAEPSKLAKVAAKVAEGMKKANALRPAIFMYILGVVLFALFALLFAALFPCAVLVPFALTTSPNFRPTDVILVIALESLFVGGSFALWQMLRHGDIYSTWHECRVLTQCI